jgi:hypothetical protein
VGIFKLIAIRNFSFWTQLSTKLSLQVGTRVRDCASSWASNPFHENLSKALYERNQINRYRTSNYRIKSQKPHDLGGWLVRAPLTQLYPIRSSPYSRHLQPYIAMQYTMPPCRTSMSNYPAIDISERAAINGVLKGANLVPSNGRATPHSLTLMAAAWRFKKVAQRSGVTRHLPGMKPPDRNT